MCWPTAASILGAAVRSRRRSTASTTTASTTIAAATKTKLPTRADAIAYAVPTTPSTKHQTTSASEKTCLTTVAPRRVVSIAPTTSAATIKPCQNGVIGRLLMAWATMDGTSDRVQANTTPDPAAASKMLVIFAALYALGARYWVCEKMNRQVIPAIAAPSPQSSASLRWQYPESRGCISRLDFRPLNLT